LHTPPPPPPLPGTVGGEEWGFDPQLKIQMPHHLGKSGDQIPSNSLHLEAIKWGFDQTNGRIPHPMGTYSVKN